MSDGIGLAEVLLGLPGFRVLDVVESAVEVVITIESTAVWAHCRSTTSTRPSVAPRIWRAAALTEASLVTSNATISTREPSRALASASGPARDVSRMVA